MPVIDSFVNVLPDRVLRRLVAQPGYERLRELFEPTSASGADPLVAVMSAMDDAGVDGAVVTTGLVGDGTGVVSDASLEAGRHAADLISACRRHGDRFRVALTVDQLPGIRAVTELVEHFAEEPLVRAIRIVPLLHQIPIDDRTWYPIYERCEALGLPVTINVGLPGPRVKGRCQHPALLDEVLVDFPGLTVVAAHVGHPWEGDVVALMRKFPTLHLMTSAFLATRLDPAVIRHLSSSRGSQQVLFATDYPMLDFGRALSAARSLDVPAESLEALLGSNGARLFGWA